MRWFVPVAAILLAGCGQSAGEKAEAEYRIARESGVTSDQACEFETRIRDAYLSDENREKYDRWRIAAATSCNEAALERLM
jgi:outer membrane biogenesis lipoprotein LolB